MRLIESEIINDRVYYYYEGLDINMIKNHPRDGSGGLIIFLIESFITEMKNQNRDRKLNSVLKNKEFIPIDTESMAHDFVAIYQYEGVGMKNMIDVVKKQMREYGNDMFGFNNEYH